MVLFMMAMGCIDELYVECGPEDVAASDSLIFEDRDRDGHPNRDEWQCNNETDNDQWVVVQVGSMDTVAWDCDDLNPDVNDGGIWYLDADGDGWGGDVSLTACVAPLDHVEKTGDCNDDDGRFHPGADESDCTDPEDYNCDGSVDFEDGDDDGFAACEDCDDTNADIFPGATEICDDIDNDCDNAVDDDDDDVTGATTWYGDTDQDTWGDDADVLERCDQPDGYVERGGDCDDTSTRYYPGAEESDCTDPEDYNCDGSTGFTDADEDGFAACEECDDSDPTVFPGGDEICNGLDDDCDGKIDDSDDSLDASTGTVFYADTDGDTFGDASNTTQTCDQPSGYVTDDQDCDDGSAATYPGANEYCDGVDTDCDGTLDEDDALDVSTWYPDVDEDGWGDGTATTMDACDQPSGYVGDSTDCDDSDDLTYPGVASQDSSTDCMTDADEDGYGSQSPASGVTAGTDCDDAEVNVNPGATEYCGSTDHDCDGVIGDDDDDVDDGTTWYADNDGDGYGDASSSISTCDTTAPSGYDDDTDDCDDTDANVGICLVYVSCTYNGSDIDVSVSFDSSATVSDITGGSTSSASSFYLRKPSVNEQVDKTWSGVGTSYSYSAFSRGYLELCFSDECSSHLVQSNVTEVTGDCSDASTGADLYIDAN